MLRKGLAFFTLAHTVDAYGTRLTSEYGPTALVGYSCNCWPCLCTGTGGLGCYVTAYTYLGLHEAMAEVSKGNCYTYTIQKKNVPIEIVCDMFRNCLRTVGLQPLSGCYVLSNMQHRLKSLGRTIMLTTYLTGLGHHVKDRSPTKTWRQLLWQRFAQKYCKNVSWPTTRVNSAEAVRNMTYDNCRRHVVNA